MKTKLSIKNRFTGSIIFEYESEDNTIKKTLLEAIKCNSNLRGSNLRGSNLRGSDLSNSDLSNSDLSNSDLSNSDLRGSNLRGSDLRGSDLRGSDLRGSDLRGSNLRGCDLRPIKNDFFVVLLHSIPEIPFLKQNIIDGKIDGSTYDGDCACLSGTLMNGVKKHNGPQELEISQKIMSCRDAGRPIERFFLGIAVGDTPETSQFSKLALEWLTEFEMLIQPVMGAKIPVKKVTAKKVTAKKVTVKKSQAKKSKP